MTAWYTIPPMMENVFITTPAPLGGVDVLAQTEEAYGRLLEQGRMYDFEYE